MSGDGVNLERTFRILTADAGGRPTAAVCSSCGSGWTAGPDRQPLEAWAASHACLGWYLALRLSGPASADVDPEATFWAWWAQLTQEGVERTVARLQQIADAAARGGDPAVVLERSADLLFYVKGVLPPGADVGGIVRPVGYRHDPPRAPGNGPGGGR